MRDAPTARLKDGCSRQAGPCQSVRDRSLGGDHISSSEFSCCISMEVYILPRRKLCTWGRRRVPTRGREGGQGPSRLRRIHWLPSAKVRNPLLFSRIRVPKM
jgi:hypothetical protein